MYSIIYLVPAIEHVWPCIAFLPRYMIFALNDHLPRFFPLADWISSQVLCQLSYLALVIKMILTHICLHAFFIQHKKFELCSISLYILYLSIKCLFLDIIGLITMQTTRLCRQNEYQALAWYDNLSAPPCVLKGPAIFKNKNFKNFLPCLKFEIYLKITILSYG